MARTTRKIPIDINLTTGSGEAEEPAALGPLFAFEGDVAVQHARTRVYREEPIDEGHLGHLADDADEGTLFNRWGGGTFKLQAIDTKGRLLGQRTVKVAGEPRFDSPISKRRYTRWLAESFPSDASAAGAPGTGGDPVALEEARHAREIARIKAETEGMVAKIRAEVADKEAAEERRRARDREDRRAERELSEAKEESRRERERDERKAEREERTAIEDRRWKAEMELRREAQAQRTDPMAQFASVLQMVTAMQGGQGGSEFPDVATAFAARLPETIEAVRGAALDVVAAGAGGGKGDGDSYDPRSDVLLQGDLAGGLKGMVASLKRQGKSEGEIASIMAAMFSTVAKARPLKRGAPPASRPTAAASRGGAHIQHRKAKGKAATPKNGAAVNPDAVIPPPSSGPKAVPRA
jgi:hypothetical protein